MKKRSQVVVIGIIQKGDTYLVTKRIQTGKDDAGFNGKWQFPGGGLEFGEAPSETLVRELKEELDVEVSILRYLRPLSVIHYTWWHGILLPYVCELKDPNAEIRLNEEASEYRWCTKSEIKKLEAILSLYTLVDML